MKISLLGYNNQELVKERIKKIATAGKLSRANGTISEIYNSCDDNEKNLKFIERVINMGHKSIIEHDYLIFSIENVTPIVEQLLIEERFSSFTIKSRREVDFSQAGYYIPNFRDQNGNIIKNNDELKAKYKLNADTLFNTYKILINNGIPKEDARYILPYSFNSTIIMGIDTHTLNRLVVRLLKKTESKYSEYNELGKELYNIIENNMPYLKNEIDKEMTRSNDFVGETMKEKMPQVKGSASLLSNVELLSATNNIDEEIIKSSIMKVYGIPYYFAEEYYIKNLKNDDEFINKLFMNIYKSNDRSELKQVNFRFQIPISYAALTHLTRHRTHDLIVPNWISTDNISSFVKPKSYDDYCNCIVNSRIIENQRLYNSFKENGVCEEDLIYFHLAGNMVNVVTNMDGATLAHILHLRTCNKAQWEIREIADQMKELVSKNCKYYKNILGPDCEVLGICPEKKESCGKIRQLIKK